MPTPPSPTAPGAVSGSVSAAATPEDTPTPAAPAALRPGPVLAASDGSALGTNAALVAGALAARHGRDARVVHVVNTRAAPIPSPMDLAVALADAVLGPGVRGEVEFEVRARIETALGHAVDWPMHVTLGAPGRAIADDAEDVGAALVVVGLQHHGRLARLARDETTLHVARAARCPVLAATAALGAPPRRVLAAVDFSRASLGAARAALALLGGDGTLVLAYVPERPHDDPENGEHRVHALGVDAALAWAEQELAAPPAVRVERVVLRGAEPCAVSALLLDHADRIEADLLAVGSRRHGRVERWVLGSVAADVLRDGRVSVLVVPPEDEQANVPAHEATPANRDAPRNAPAGP